MRVLAIVLLCNLGCRSAPGAGEPARVAEPPAEAPPAAETMTYVSGAKVGPPAPTGEPALETDAAEAKRVAAVAGIPAKLDTIAAARELALGAADGAFGQTGERLMTPALVPAWPAEKRALIFVVYPLTSSKTGINRFVVGAPVEVTVDLLDGTTATRKLRRSAVLGEIEVGRDSSTVRQNIDTAEQTLIDLLLERRSVDRSLVLLDGYREWFNHHLDVMTDLDHRMPKGLRWLRQPQVP
ncbi:MAG: hypothetical protein IPO88_29565 [Nannocystis sp.]|uniref:hypothetical protein n=1 Tax=Nannocystis sp. TaxID=1962667 RepID=UPI002425E4DB|nr:hypothetical protein [Nannocystis sp.]MBK9757580.1 hypothetical protein [Nannocystis sp.]